MASAIAGADACRLVHRAADGGLLTRLGSGAFDVIAAGKAAVPMTQALLECAPRPRGGLVVSPPTTALVPAPLALIESAHPVPDQRSVRASEAALHLAREVPPGACLIVLLSGGASALMALPAPGLSLDAKQEVTRRLLRTGADIHAVNCVRKHLSAIKGGRLAGACRGRVVTLAVSDVTGDEPSVIGSGPTAPDPTTYADALRVLDTWGGRSAFPADAVRQLAQGAAGDAPETPKPGDDSVARSTVHVIGSRADALDGAAQAARRLGYRVVSANRLIVGEARARGAEHAAWIAAMAGASAEPLCLLSAGETTVQVTGSGKGGRNQELALAAAPGLASVGRSVALASVGTDGVDGPTDAAGAMADSTTMARAVACGIDPMQYLGANDAWSFFDRLGDLLRTGPTGTNVGDVQIALIARREGEVRV